jgi:hypothetical protein
MSAPKPIVDEKREHGNGARGQSLAWASGALVLAGAVGVLAKVGGVLIAPGMHGIAEQSVMTKAEALISTLAYALVAMLVALVCTGSFELARRPRIGTLVHGSVVTISGLIIALASPAVVDKLHPFAAFALAVFSAVIAFSAGVVVVRAPRTRALGVVLILLSVCGLLQPIAWGAVTLASEHASLTEFTVGRVAGTTAIVVQSITTLFIAAWLAARSRSNRFVVNGALLLAFVITYLAARNDAPSSPVIAVLRASLLRVVISMPASSAVSTIAAFLLPVSLLLTVIALAQRRLSAAIKAPIAFALLSLGGFDVPLQALAITTAATWALLAMTDT